MINIAHIHPMLVHFPIVLFFIAVGVELIVLIRGGDLIGQQCLPRIALSALVLAALAAIVAASFGDMAFDKAIDLGFPRPPLEEHEELGFTTMWFFIGLSVLHVLALWRKIPLSGAKGWVIFALGLIGIGILLVTAYHGGELVYRFGVNVLPVKP